MTRKMIFYANEHSDYTRTNDDGVTSSAAVRVGRKIIFKVRTWLIH